VAVVVMATTATLTAAVAMVVAMSQAAPTS
jgi:hypothetical protein